MGDERTSGEERDRQRWTEEEREALRTRNKLKSTYTKGHSRSIAERRCRLSAFVTVREAELGVIVPIQPDLEFG